MKNPAFLLLLSGAVTAFMAVLISALFKRFLIPNQENLFKQTLKFGLLGGLVGLALFFAIWNSRKLETNSWDAPGIIAIIPFYFMLAGQLVGVILVNRKKNRN